MLVELCGLGPALHLLSMLLQSRLYIGSLRDLRGWILGNFALRMSLLGSLILASVDMRPRLICGLDFLEQGMFADVDVAGHAARAPGPLLQ